MSNQIFEKKSDCCGCGACQAICPKNAIEMIEDEYGFVYPKLISLLIVACTIAAKSTLPYDDCSLEYVASEIRIPAVFFTKAVLSEQIQKIRTGEFKNQAYSLVRKKGKI